MARVFLFHFFLVGQFTRRSMNRSVLIKDNFGGENRTNFTFSPLILFCPRILLFIRILFGYSDTLWLPIAINIIFYLQERLLCVHWTSPLDFILILGLGCVCTPHLKLIKADFLSKLNFCLYFSFFKKSGDDWLFVFFMYSSKMQKFKT